MPPLKDLLQGKYIVCSCEGHAEQAVVDLLLDSRRLCFRREDLIGGECTQIRKGAHLAREFLNMETEKDIAIVRVLDRPKEKLVLPKIYEMRGDIQTFNIVTQPEIEILHIIDEGLFEKFRHQRDLKKPSAYCKRHIAQTKQKQIKSREFICRRYEGNLDRLAAAIRRYRALVSQEDYCLADLLC